MPQEGSRTTPAPFFATGGGGEEREKRIAEGAGILYADYISRHEINLKTGQEASHEKKIRKNDFFTFDR